MATRTARPAAACMLALTLVGACSRRDDCLLVELLPSPAGSQTVAPGEPDGSVVTGAAVVLGTKARSLSGRIQPRGRAGSYYFEYGPSTSYGQQTATRALPPRLAAHYRETWDEGAAGWRHGMKSELAEFVASGGASGGFIRHREPTDGDANHLDGVGFIHLGPYYYPGTYPADSPGEEGFWAAGDPDVRDARVSMWVRGVDFAPNGAELVWWSQKSLPAVEAEGDGGWRAANWAFTGFSFIDALATGRWEKVEYRLVNDPSRWTYAGRAAYQNRPNYTYAPLDETLAHNNTNFIHVFLFANAASGAVDFDELEVTYRNHSVLLPSNGGSLRSSPPGSEGADALTDGWRNGPGKTWRSALSPTSPQEIVWDLARPISIERLQIHQDPDWPSKDVELSVSNDGKEWSTVGQWTLPERHPNGPNFAFVHARDLRIEARAVRVRVLGGYKAERWGLGEVEVFGAGGVYETDDDWYNLNADVSGLLPGNSYHYRLVHLAGTETDYGADREFTTPTDDRPIAETLPPRRTAQGTATFDARVVPMGLETHVWFEYGAPAACPTRTATQYAGLTETPRTVTAAVAGLPSGSTLYYRIVAQNLSGLVRSAPVRFTVP